jgi:predicted nucleic acid-binding protein
VPYTALLDACVLYPSSLRDLLLRLGERGLFRPLWSTKIIDEMVDAVLRNRPDLDRSKLTRTVGLMREFFPDAEVAGFQEIVDVMTNDEGDRHVLAAAVRGRADVIVTRNVRHFPPKSLEPYDMLVQTPDEFLIHQFTLSPDVVVQELRNQAESNRQPPRTMPELLDSLAVVAPSFCDLVRQSLEEA